jgi:hypothetical protein
MAALSMRALALEWTIDTLGSIGVGDDTNSVKWDYGPKKSAPVLFCVDRAGCMYSFNNLHHEIVKCNLKKRSVVRRCILPSMLFSLAAFTVIDTNVVLLDRDSLLWFFRTADLSLVKKRDISQLFDRSRSYAEYFYDHYIVVPNLVHKDQFTVVDIDRMVVSGVITGNPYVVPPKSWFAESALPFKWPTTKEWIVLGQSAEYVVFIDGDENDDGLSVFSKKTGALGRLDPFPYYRKLLAAGRTTFVFTDDSTAVFGLSEPESPDHNWATYCRISFSAK